MLESAPSRTMTARLSLIAPLLALGLFAQTAHSAQVLWGSARLAFNYVSTGEPDALGSDFTFQLGSFDAGFTPTADNVSSWLAHWTPAQSVNYNANTRFFTGSYSYQTATEPFTSANRAYIFGFNRWAASEGDTHAEWILATDPNWRWPAAIGGIAPPVQWSMSNAQTVILGSINNPNSTAHMQTAAVNTPLEFLNLEFWAKRYTIGTDEASLATDPDGDGLTNLEEFEGSTNPLIFNQTDAPETRAPIIEFVQDSSELFTELALFKLGLPSGASLTPQISSDLVTWQPATSAFDVRDDSILIYRVRSKSPVVKGVPRFYRIKVETAP
jgi:hypothetical protein